MSLELDIRIWWDSNDRLKQIQQVLAVFEQCRGEAVEWKPCVMKRSVPGGEGLTLNSPVTTAQFMDWVVDDLSHHKVTLYSHLPCWRFGAQADEKASVPIAFSFWGKEFGKTIGFDQRQEGNGQITLLQCSPYIGTVISKASESEARLRNDRMEENLDALIELLKQVSIQSAPSKWMAFANNGAPYVPIHAFAGWFANPDVLLDCVSETLDTLRHGRPQDKLPAVAEIETLQGTGYQHSFRSPAEAAQLLLGMKAAAKYGLPPQRAQLQKALENGAIDSIPIKDGQILLDYPFFLNNFLDAFLLSAIPMKPASKH